MDAFIALPIAAAAGIGIATLVIANSSPRRLLGDRIRRFDAVSPEVLDAELARAARGTSRSFAGALLVALVFLVLRAIPIVSDTLSRAPIPLAVAGLFATVVIGVLIAYLELAWIRGAILRRLERNLAA